jgi:hypothetical protein
MGSFRGNNDGYSLNLAIPIRLVPKLGTCAAFSPRCRKKTPYS